MACRLAESGYELAVYNRTRSKGEEAEKLGARLADSAADAAREADVVMLSLADQHVVDALLFGEDGAMGTFPAGGYIVDMSTVPPDLRPRAGREGLRGRPPRRSTRASWERRCTPGRESCA